MINNIDYNIFKKNSFKLIGTIALSGILTFNLTGCVLNDNSFNNNSDDIVSEQEIEEVEKAPCTIEIIGADNYYHDGKAPHFSLFIRHDENDEWNLYSSFVCKEDTQSTRLTEGYYKLYSEDIGRFGFAIDNIDVEYTITVDYNNKIVKLNGTQLNIIENEKTK